MGIFYPCRINVGNNKDKIDAKNIRIRGINCKKHVKFYMPVVFPRREEEYCRYQTVPIKLFRFSSLERLSFFLRRYLCISTERCDMLSICAICFVDIPIRI